MNHSFRLATIAAVGTLAIGGIAIAQQAGNAPTEMALSQIVQKLEAAGYTRIDEIERDQGVWEVEATSVAGTRVDLHIDPSDGRVVSEKPDSDD